MIVTKVSEFLRPKNLAGSFFLCYYKAIGMIPNKEKDNGKRIRCN